MEQKAVRTLLEQVAKGKTSIDEALLQLKKAPFEDIGFAKLDYHRGLRQGVAEVIYGAGKTTEQIIKIIENIFCHILSASAEFLPTPSVREYI